MFNFHDAQGPYSGFIDLPYGVTFTNTFNVPLSQVSNVDPERAARRSAAPSCATTTSSRAPRAGA